METFESIGVAKNRAYEMGDAFAGGVVTAYEQLL